MNVRDPVLVGFFPKRTVKRADWLKNHGVEEICSVSECESKGPDDWIQMWKHNDLGFYDSETLASKCAGADSASYDIYAYKLFPFEFEEGQVLDFQIPLRIDADLSSFRFLGYEASNRSAGSYFECSALSCNYGAQDFPVNRHCLFEELSVAYEATIEISSGQYEPGPWYLLEVHRKEVGNR